MTSEKNSFEHTTDIVLTGLIGTLAGICLIAGINAVSADEGRGPEIVECPKEYQPMIGVEDESVLGRLAIIAKNKSIHDSFGEVKKSDSNIADQPGELACRPSLNQTVLLPAGQTAMQYSADFDRMTNTLPNGLVWISQPPTR
jgi:hypothetical protein